MCVSDVKKNAGISPLSGKGGRKSKESFVRSSVSRKQENSTRDVRILVFTIVMMVVSVLVTKMAIEPEYSVREMIGELCPVYGNASGPVVKIVEGQGGFFVVCATQGGMIHKGFREGTTGNSGRVKAIDADNGSEQESEEARVA